MTRKIVFAAVLLICIWTVTGCNTVRGLGKDIQHGGEAIEKAAGK